MSVAPKCHNKPFKDCTDQELREELAYWEQRLSSSPSWGAAVGAASSFVREIKEVLRMREDHDDLKSLPPLFDYTGVFMCADGTPAMLKGGYSVGAPYVTVETLDDGIWTVHRYNHRGEPMPSAMMPDRDEFIAKRRLVPVASAPYTSKGPLTPANPPMPHEIEKTLQERKKTHGDFKQVAQMMQQTKALWRDSKNWGELSPIKQAVLDEIAHKVARVLFGDPDNPEHWHDIGGYARLAEKEEK